MSIGVNKAMIIGHLGQDPDVRFTTDGKAVANVSVATTMKYKENEYTEWHRVVFFGRLAEIVSEYLSKGALVYISGRLQTRKWQDKEGNDRYSTEIVANELQMLGGKSNAGVSRAQEQVENTPDSDDFPDDDIPF